MSREPLHDGGGGTAALRVAPFRAATQAFAIVGLFACLLAAPSPVRAADSLAVHAEIGGSVDTSNEFYYEDTYTDTTFLGRRLHDTPESRIAGVAAAEIGGRHGPFDFSLRPEVTLGDKVTRLASAATLSARTDGGWRFVLEPRVEHSRDLSFGITRRQELFATRARARRTSVTGADALDLRGSGEWLSTPGSSDPFLLAHRASSVGAGWSHMGLFGPDLDLRYDLVARAFPDSQPRDHFEHQAALGLHQDFSGGHAAELDAELDRRVTQHVVGSSRDRFLEGRAAARGVVRLGDAWSIRGGVEAELVRYDAPDSVLDFDYHVERAHLTLRREVGLGFSAGIGPRAEWLGAPWNAAERYHEYGGAIALELLSASHWWSLEPSAGWRGYALSESGGTGEDVALHSSYAFLDLQAMGDQALPGRLKARVMLAARLEKHRDAAQDARSLYFSFDLRRLF